MWELDDGTIPTLAEVGRESVPRPKLFDEKVLSRRRFPSAAH